jgi:hypothetical protein
MKLQKTAQSGPFSSSVTGAIALSEGNIPVQLALPDRQIRVFLKKPTNAKLESVNLPY